MKHLVLALAAFGLFACSSADKAEHHAHETNQEVTDQAKAAIEEAAEDLKNAAEDLKDTAAETVADAQASATTAASDASEFTAYTGTESSKVTCTNGDDVRTITVLNGENGGCGVVYNKFGVDKTVAVANNVMSYCTEVQEKIKGNLEGPGFTCQ